MFPGNPPSSSSSSSSIPVASEDYAYYSFIKPPSKLGMSDKGSNIAKNFTGLVEYVNLLVYGKSKASTTGQPLGNKFFAPTLSKCTLQPSKESVPRDLYFDFIPTGKMDIAIDPLDAANEMQIDTGYKGLVPGLMEDINDINPVRLLSSLSEDIAPECIKVSLDTIDDQNVLGAETHYVTLSDLRRVSECNFLTNYNPVTKIRCKRPHKHASPIDFTLPDNGISSNMMTGSSRRRGPAQQYAESFTAVRMGNTYHQRCMMMFIITLSVCMLVVIWYLYKGCGCNT